MAQVNEGMRQKENSERLEWLQIHVDLHTEEKALQVLLLLLLILPTPWHL